MWLNQDRRRRGGYRLFMASPWRKIPKPHEVFTPGSPPLEANNIYVNRAAAEADLRRFLERRQVPVVWGEYGVGKTTLVQRYFQDEGIGDRLVYVSSVAGVSLTDVFRVILEHLNYTVTVETTTNSTDSDSAGFDLKVVKADFRGDRGSSSRHQLVVSSPTDAGMNNILREERLTVVLDEMHKASESLRSKLSDWIKATRTGGDGFRLVLVGTSTDAGRLVALDHGIDRYIKEMPIALLTADEARYIINEGFRRLELAIDPDLRDRIVTSAAGAPTIVQALCLDAAEAALEADRWDVLEVDVKEAVRLYLKEHGGRLNDHYFKAIETTGRRRYRKQILQAVASVDNDYATMDDIRSRVSIALHEDVPATSLSGPLRDLKNREYGAILKDVDREVSGARVHNLTTFTDPMMKSFVRFMNNLDKTSLMPSTPARSTD